jgi:hypothetical protein
VAINVSGSVMKAVSGLGKAVVGTLDDGLFSLRWEVSNVAIAPFSSKLEPMDNPALGGYRIHKNDGMGFRFWLRANPELDAYYAAAP